MAQDQYAHLVGTRIALEEDRGPMKPCRFCGCCTGTITGPSAGGVHLAGIRCEGCERHVGWLSKRHLDAIAAMKGAA